MASVTDAEYVYVRTGETVRVGRAAVTGTMVMMAEQLISQVLKRKNGYCMDELIARVGSPCHNKSKNRQHGK